MAPGSEWFPRIPVGVTVMDESQLTWLVSVLAGSAIAVCWELHEIANKLGELVKLLRRDSEHRDEQRRRL